MNKVLPFLIMIILSFSENLFCLCPSLPDGIKNSEDWRVSEYHNFSDGETYRIKSIFLYSNTYKLYPDSPRTFEFPKNQGPTSFEFEQEVVGDSIVWCVYKFTDLSGLKEFSPATWRFVLEEGIFLILEYIPPPSNNSSSKRKPCIIQ